MFFNRANSRIQLKKLCISMRARAQNWDGGENFEFSQKFWGFSETIFAIFRVFGNKELGIFVSVLIGDHCQRPPFILPPPRPLIDCSLLRLAGSCQGEKVLLQSLSDTSPPRKLLFITTILHTYRLGYNDLNNLVLPGRLMVAKFNSKSHL
jgi:hypothetical protein